MDFYPLLKHNGIVMPGEHSQADKKPGCVLLWYRYVSTMAPSYQYNARKIFTACPGISGCYVFQKMIH
ncbi:MAG: hypothetical protein J1F02_00590 [Lachnospiraceae bacterium]|nr:hypothetical protein [Lachnospiraceae bacterium]